MLIVFKHFHLILGLTGAEGKVWKEHRDFVSTTLKEMSVVKPGTSKALIEQQIQRSVKELIAVCNSLTYMNKVLTALTFDVLIYEFY